MIISGPSGTTPSVTNTSSNIVFEYYYKNQEAYQLLLDDVNVWAKPYYCLLGLTYSTSTSSIDYSTVGVYVVPDFDITQYSNGYNSPEPYAGQQIYKNNSLAIANYFETIGRWDGEKEEQIVGSRWGDYILYHGENYKIIQMDSWGIFHELGTISSPTEDVYMNVSMAIDSSRDHGVMNPNIDIAGQQPVLNISTDKNYFLLYNYNTFNSYSGDTYFYYYFKDANGNIMYANALLIDEYADNDGNPSISAPIPLINVNENAVKTIECFFYGSGQHVLSNTSIYNL